MTSRFRRLFQHWGLWSLWGIFAVIAITEGVAAAVSLEHNALPGSLLYALWFILRTIVILALQTAFMQLILGFDADQLKVWRAITAVLYSVPMLAWFGFHAVVAEPPAGAFMPVTLVFYAIVLALLSILALLFSLVRGVRSVMA